MRALFLSLAISIPLLGLSQARLVINDDAYIVMENQVVLVIDNSSSDAITTTGSGGNIVSELENNRVQWNIADYTGTYVVPFTTTPASQGGNDVKIPVTVTVTSAGTTDGQISFSTYETITDLNTAYPSDVNNMLSGPAGGVDGSLYAVDRFWIIDAYTYTTRPDLSMMLAYDDNSNEIAGTNTIIEANLAAQYYNSSLDLWEGLEGASNTVNNTVSPINIAGTSLYRSWTLVDNNTSLSLHKLQLEAKNVNNTSAELTWTVNTNKDISHFEVERSVNGKDFTKLGTVAANKAYRWDDMHPAIGSNYYRISLYTTNGKRYVSHIREVVFQENYTTTLFPNPTNGGATLTIAGAYDELVLTIYNTEGRHIYQTNYYGVEQIQLDEVNALPGGVYYVQLQVDNGYTRSMKLVKQN